MSKKDQVLFEAYNIDPSDMPQHIAIIMDGNGRWAKEKKMSRTEGHKAGRKVLKNTVENCIQLGIKHLSVYAFSTENWSRPKHEVDFLMFFFNQVIKKELTGLIDNNIKIRFFGGTKHVSRKLLSGMKKIETQTNKSTSLNLNIMFNYGGRDEILSATKTLLNAKQDPDTLTEDLFSNTLYTKGIPDPDILIRTGDEVRVSNYMLWQIAYTELFFIPDFWPNFSITQLVNVIRNYQKRNRRYGGLNT